MDLSDASLARIVAIVQQQVTLQIDSLEQKVHTRFLDIERRVKAVEDAIVANFGAGALPSRSHAPPTTNVSRSSTMTVLPGPQGIYIQQVQLGNQREVQFPAVTGPSGIGSSQNAGFLPYAMEMIAMKYRQKGPQDDRQCGNRSCSRLTFHIDCFRKEHFRWCRKHHRPILPPHYNCGRDYKGCQSVRWEHHPDWETIVNMSFVSGKLGKQGVHDLLEILFPRDLYPNKYDEFGNWTG